MDTFEKQQRIDSVRGIIKARWFMVAIIVVLGLILKARFFGGLWGNFFDFIKIIGMGLIVLSYNIVFWLIVRRPAEKIGNRTLGFVAAMQVISDQLIYTLVYYYTGTIETIAFLLYYLTIMVASSLYKTKGIILTGALAIFLYSGAMLADYYRLVPHIYPLVDQAQSGWFGNLFMTRVKIVGFAFYTGAAIFFSVFLSALIKDREAGLRQQRDQLSVQTQELTQAQGQLQGALTRSDVARKAATQARDEMEKANIELKQKIDELEKFYNITIGREVRMAELKEKIKELEGKIKKEKTK